MSSVIRSSLGIEMSYTCIGTWTTAQHLHFFKRRKHTEAIIRTFVEIRDTFQKGSEMELKNNTRLMWKISKVYTIVFFGVCFGMSLPFLWDLMLWSIWKTPRAFKVPGGMDSLIDKEPIRDAKYFAVVITSDLWTVVGGISQTGIDIFLFVTCYSFTSMIKTFCKSLRLHPEFTPEETTAHLRQLAAHQQALYKLSIELRNIFGFPFFMQNVMGALSICTLLYAMSVEYDNLLIQFVYFANMLVIVMLLASTAHVAQHVKNTTSDIFYALYDMDWYTLRPSDRRYMVTMLSLARQPFSIDFRDLFPLDMQNFMHMLNTSYTYFMFLKSME